MMPSLYQFPCLPFCNVPPPLPSCNNTNNTYHNLSLQTTGNDSHTTIQSVPRDISLNRNAEVRRAVKKQHRQG